MERYHDGGLEWCLDVEFTMIGNHVGVLTLNSARLNSPDDGVERSVPTTSPLLTKVFLRLLLRRMQC